MPLSAEHPDFLWRNPSPKSSYEVVIVGGGGHGLATAYYLAKNHGITDVAVFDPQAFGERGTVFEPNLLAEGMRHVLVNGAPTLRDGELTGKRGGMVLRR